MLAAHFICPECEDHVVEDVDSPDWPQCIRCQVKLWLLEVFPGAGRIRQLWRAR